MSNIGKLIRKELIFLVGSMRLQLIIILLFVTLFPMIAPTLSFIGCIVVPYFAIYGAMAYEEKGKGEHLVVTLPVKRSEICWSKYLLGILYTIVGVILSLICVQIGNLILPGSITRQFVLSEVVSFGISMIVIGTLYTALMIPILLKVGTEKSRYVMFLIYILSFILSSSLGEVLEEGIEITMNPTTLMVIGGIISLAGYVLSFCISNYILKNKEFY